MPNKQMPSAPICQPGALLLGDSFNMRHPLTGGGMTVALADTKLLCDMLQPVMDFTDPKLTSAATRHFYTKRKPVSATINTLANALYKVFCSTGSKPHEEMRQVCVLPLLYPCCFVPLASQWLWHLHFWASVCPLCFSYSACWW